MVKSSTIERDATGKFTGRTINREDYEYTLRSTFVNGTILITAISVYVAVAYAVIQQFRK
jgi:hypothetical protein